MAAAVLADGKAMSLVVDVRHQCTHGAWHIGEHAHLRVETGEQVVGVVFLVFGECNDGDVMSARIQDAQHGVELGFATIDEDEIG